MRWRFDENLDDTFNYSYKKLKQASAEKALVHYVTMYLCVFASSLRD